MFPDRSLVRVLLLSSLTQLITFNEPLVGSDCLLRRFPLTVRFDILCFVRRRSIPVLLSIFQIGIVPDLEPIIHLILLFRFDLLGRLRQAGL